MLAYCQATAFQLLRCHSDTLICIVSYPSSMILTGRTVDGHRYWEVATSARILRRPRKQVLLYLGRLDGLASTLIEQKRQQVRALGDSPLSLRFDALLSELGYPPPLPSLKDLDLATVRSYGPDLALFRLGEELAIVPLIEADSPKGGGPPLGKLVLALSIFVNLHPGASYFHFPEWYRRSGLSIFLGLPPDQVTYETTLNALSYLQPERTRSWESAIYRQVLKVFHYRCERVDIDSTVKELGGRRCRFLAKFGKAKYGTVSKRRQVMITFLVDQKGSLLGHEIFPGNKNDAKTLAPVDRRLRGEYGAEIAEAPRVVDRGYASLANVKSLQRRKERFLVAVRAQPEGLGLLEALGPQEGWAEILPGVRAASLEREGAKWVVTWNDEVAERTGDGRRAKRKKALADLEALAKAIREGRVKSRSERDRRVGAIVRKHGMKRFLKVHGDRKGLGFRVEETGALEARQAKDGYQVYATTETWLTEKAVVEFYRHRDRIEKAIRTMSSALGLGPVWVQTPEHVRGHVFVHALGYQLRNAGQLRLEEKRETMSIEEALWELEKLQVGELVVKGSEVGITRKLTRMDGTVVRLAQVFSLSEKGQFPGVEGGI